MAPNGKVARTSPPSNGVNRVASPVDAGPSARPAGRMSLQEARQVPWLRSRPKPLGELLEDGYLNRSRLEWAAKNAYNPRLKEAAQLLLEWQSRTEPTESRPISATTDPALKAPVRVGISLEHARTTAWPFGALQGRPMGELSATKELSLRDLAYAIESAWDERVRQAAIALLLERLDQELKEPPQTAGNLRVFTSKRSYAERRQLSLAFIEGIIGGAGFALAVGLLVSSIFQRGPAGGAMALADVIRTPEGVVSLFLFLVIAAGALGLVLYLQSRVFKRLDRQIESFRFGQEGEDRVVEKAHHSLDGNWALFRNLVLPGRKKADLDVVLVGPPGVWVIEVKALRGAYRNVGETWAYRSRGAWTPMRKSPSRQARIGAIALAEFLKADRVKTFVEAAVAWASSDGSLFVDNPTVPVWTMDRLEDELGNLWNGHRLDRPTQDRITNKLATLYEKPANGSW